jgi:hypothetical protein
MFEKVKKILKEPLSIFALVAVFIFAYDAWFGGEDESSSSVSAFGMPDNTLVVDDNIVALLQENFSWLEGREPNQEETQKLVELWIDEELLFREALAMQMHMNDGKMRAHLIEKVRMLWAGAPEPTDEADLLNFYMENMNEYYTERTVSFSQVYFRELPEDPHAVLERLQAGDVIAGDDYWLGNELNSYSESILRTSFGGAFFIELLEASEGSWVGPLESARGYHYARVTAIGEPELMSYRDIRGRISLDWADRQRRDAVRQRTENVKKRFNIVMEVGGA